MLLNTTEEDPSNETVAQITREFVDTYYKSLGSGPNALTKFFSNESIIDQIFIDQIQHRSTNRHLISTVLSNTYRPGINTIIKNVFWQQSPNIPCFIVTVAGLFRQNGNSWPFLHVFYTTVSIYSNQKFVITNAVLYDCINQCQLTSDDSSINDQIECEYEQDNEDDSLSEEFYQPLHKLSLTDYSENAIRTPSITTKVLSKSPLQAHQMNGNGFIKQPISQTIGPDLCTVTSIKSDDYEEFDRKYSEGSYNNHENNKQNISDPMSLPHRKIDDPDSLVESSTEYSFDSNTIFVGSYPDLTTEDDIIRLFSRFGSIQSIKMIPQKKIAFVTFKNSGSVSNVLKENELKMGDRVLRVQQRKIINTVKHAKRENLEFYGYSRDDNHRRSSKPKK